MSDDLDITITPKGLYALQLIAQGMPLEQAEAEANMRFSDENTPREAN